LSDRARRLVAACILLSLSAAVETKQPGEAAPDFSRVDVAGKAVHLGDYRGKLILLNFWASWCGPCLAEMPRFSRWQTVYGPKGLQVIGISMDDGSSPVMALLKRRPVSYPIVMGDATLGEEYGGVFGLPLTYLIGANGRVLARYAGESDLAAMEAAIKRALPRVDP